MYEQALERVAELSNFLFLLCGIVFVLGAVVLAFWKKLNDVNKEHKKEIAVKDKAIAKLNSANLETLKDNTAAMVKMMTLFDEIRNDIKDVKNGD